VSDVIVIGAGIAGLSAAYRLQQAGVDVEVVDRASVAGGVLRTVQKNGWRHEWGPNSLLGSATAVFKLSDELGLTTVEARSVVNKRFLFLDGKLQAVPSNPLDAITSKMLPASAKLRLLSGAFKSSQHRDEETIKEFFDTHLGHEVTERFVDAFVSGVYAGDVSEMSIAASFPKIYDAVKEHGSLFNAMKAMGKASASGTSRRGTFSFAGGLGDLPHALVQKLGARLHLNHDVALSREGSGWRVGDRFARAVIIAAPAYSAAKLVEGELAESLASIRYNPIAGVHLLFRKSELNHALDGFGFLIPRREKVRTLGSIWASSLFDVCDSDHAMVTCFIGGAHDPEIVKLSEEQIAAEVRRDLKTTLGINATPVDQSVIRIAQAIPAYRRQHLATKKRIAALVSERKGLVLTGNYFDGVSINDTVTHAEKAAAAVRSYLAGEQQAA
jgi:oxygen-dependent protoporphyrinogen oxidase